MALVGDPLAGLAEIDDCEQHEDEGLDRADEEDVEQLPDGHEDERHHRQRGSDHGFPGPGLEERPQQVDHHHPGEDVAEKSEGQGNRLHHLLDDGERREWRAKVVVEVAAQAAHPDGVALAHEEDDQSHGERQVEVGVGRLDRLLEREEVEPVGDQDEEADGGRQGQEEGGDLLPHGLTDQVAHIAEEELEHHLEPARLAAPQGAHEEKPDREGQRVRVVGAEKAAPAADGDGGVSARSGDGEELADHRARSTSRSEAAESTNWATAMPAATRIARSQPSTNPLRIASMVRIPSRRMLVAAKAPPMPSSRTARNPFPARRMRPSARATPLSGRPSAPATTSATRAMPVQVAAVTLRACRGAAATSSGTATAMSGTGA